MKPEFADGRYAVKQAVTDCWRAVLNSTLIQPGDNFFDLGGTSVQVVELYGQLRERLAGREFEIVSLFQHPTIQSFVDFLCPNDRGESAADEQQAARARWNSSPGGAARGLTPEQRIAKQRQALENMNRGPRR